MAARQGCGEHTEERPALDVAQIFERFPAALQTLRLTPEQAKAVGAIRACRTARLGGRLLLCSSCGYQSPVYNSCRNRHCPKCQALAQGRWVEARMAHILPVPHFHVVFTVPEQLRLLIHRNRRVFFDLIFSTASRSLMTLAADPRHLGARIGLTAVLHTWTRDLSFHPHLHTIVTGGGLTPDGGWLALRSRRYLFPVKALSRLFRGKLLAAVKRAYARGEIRTDGPLAHLADPEVFQLLIDSLYGKKWVVYSKRPFAGPAQVYAYLGHYTHRVGISNHRLLDIGGTYVRFKTRFGRTACLRGEGIRAPIPTSRAAQPLRQDPSLRLDGFRECTGTGCPPRHIPDLDRGGCARVSTKIFGSNPRSRPLPAVRPRHPYPRSPHAQPVTTLALFCAPQACMTIQIAHPCRPRTAVVCAPFAKSLIERLLRGSRRAHASRTAALPDHNPRPNAASDRESRLESP